MEPEPTITESPKKFPWRLVTLGGIGLGAILAGILLSKTSEKEAAPQKTFFAEAYEGNTLQIGEANNLGKLWVENPKAKPNFTRIIREISNPGHTTGYCVKTLNPLWTLYRLEQKNPLNRESPGEFFQDSRLPNNNQGKTSDYERNQEYEMTGMAPSQNLAAHFGAEAQAGTFNMTNVAPMRPGLKSGVWEMTLRLESAYAQKYGEVIVICGPIFTKLGKAGKENKTIGAMSKIHAPDGFYKILARKATDAEIEKGWKAEEPKLICFIIPQSAPKPSSVGDLNNYLGSLQQIESETQFTFTAASPETKRNAQGLWPYP